MSQLRACMHALGPRPPQRSEAGPDIGTTFCRHPPCAMRHLGAILPAASITPPEVKATTFLFHRDTDCTLLDITYSIAKAPAASYLNSALP